MIRVTKKRFQPSQAIDHQYLEYNEIAHRVAMEANSPDYGVAVGIQYDRDYYYIMWAIIGGKMHKHRLLVSVTSEERLKAHVETFIENMRGLDTN